MKWSFARNFLRTESFFGIVAVVIAVSNAPVFQNVGTGPNQLERLFLVSYYITLIFALLALFMGRMIFEFYCPENIKEAGTLAKYLDGNPDETNEDAQIRGEMAAEWRTANESEKGLRITSIALTLFLLLFPLSFCLAALTLLQFAATKDQNQPEHLSIDIHFEQTPKCVEKLAKPLAFQCPKKPSTFTPLR